VRVGTQSRVPRLLTYAGLARRVGVGGVLIRLLRGSLRCGFLGGLFF
jgi:hypothetical protein